MLLWFRLFSGFGPCVLWDTKEDENRGCPHTLVPSPGLLSRPQTRTDLKNAMGGTSRVENRAGADKLGTAKELGESLESKNLKKIRKQDR